MKLVFFSIMADETRDISNQEQLSVYIRWIDSGFTIHEDLLEWSMLKRLMQHQLAVLLKMF